MAAATPQPYTYHMQFVVTMSLASHSVQQVTDILKYAVHGMRQCLSLFRSFML